MSRSLADALRWTPHAIPALGSAGTATLWVGEAGDGGPRAMVSAGAHGDEGPWGALALQRLLARPAQALRGRLTVVMAANPAAADADARNAPYDSLDLNRSFPGSGTGSYTERVAATLAGLLDGVDVAIDLHGGGSWCVNAFVFAFEGSEDLAHAVGAPLLVGIPEKPGTLTDHARRRGGRVVAIEMGGRSRDEMRWAQRIADGVARVLRIEGVLEAPDLPDPAPPLALSGSEVLRPPMGGVFVPEVREDVVGTVVPEGTVLGRVLDMGTMRERHVFTAPYPRTALMLLRPHVSVIEGGAMTYVVGAPSDG